MSAFKFWGDITLTSALISCFYSGSALLDSCLVHYYDLSMSSMLEPSSSSILYTSTFTFTGLPSTSIVYLPVLIFLWAFAFRSCSLLAFLSNFSFSSCFRYMAFASIAFSAIYFSKAICLSLDSSFSSMTYMSENEVAWELISSGSSSGKSGTVFSYS